jgi:hypothetical protein
MMLLVATVMALLADERPAIVIQAGDSPVRIDRATVLSTAGSPPVVLYSATNLTSDNLDQFTVMAFVFDAQGILKARQVSPARHMLEAKSSKYSTMVLDGFAVDATHLIVVGVNQAQRVGSDVWWRADLQAAADAAIKAKKPYRSVNP